MTSITLSNLSSATLAKLKAQAQLHGRSLQEEIRHILETVVEAQTSFSPQPVEPIQALASLMQQQLEHHAQLNSGQPAQFMDDQPLNLAVALENLRVLKQTISSLGALTIREAIEEGRRF
jgi:plasmid stability protein